MRCTTSRKQPAATLGQIQQINLAGTDWPSTKREFTTPSLRVVQYTVTKNTWGGTLERSLSRDFARQPTRASCVRPFTRTRSCVQCPFSRKNALPGLFRQQTASACWSSDFLQRVDTVTDALIQCLRGAIKPK